MNARSLFDRSIERARTLIAFFDHLSANVQPVLDCSDLLRSALVLTVSALDQYVHEVTVVGMIACWRGEKALTDAFRRFSYPTQVIQEYTSSSNLTRIELSVREQHGYLAFQQPDAIADALRLITDTKIWPTIAVSMQKDVKALKIELKLIVERRNKIAHEADLDPSYPGQMWPIDKSLVEGAIELIQGVVIEIERILSSPC